MQSKKQPPFAAANEGKDQIWWGWWDLNPHDLWSADFESAASAIPPQPRREVNYIKGVFRCQFDKLLTLL